uniref:Uncharacterized protein n=1 Tax=Tanacetum cinerariifolium TaxID=118510 RepID=A0A6L2M8L7_TANCI|nr:hypothetical protein [Tanacetum cinerariifolium]
MPKIRKQVILRSKSNSGKGPTSDPMSLEKTRSKESTKEVFTINQECPEQYVTIGATLTTNCKQLLVDVVQKNIKDDEKCLSRSKRTKRGNILERNSNKKQKGAGPSSRCQRNTKKAEKSKHLDPAMSSFGVKEGRFLGYMVKVVTDESMEEILKLSEGGRLAKWAAKIRTYVISYIPRKEVKGLVVKKLFGQGEQVERTPDVNEEGTLTLSKELQSKSTPTPKAWRLYLGKETIEEGLGVGIILVSPEEKVHSYATRLKFKASNHVIDYEALLACLAASANQGIEDLRVFIDSLTLVAQVEGNRTPVMEHEKKYKE